MRLYYSLVPAPLGFPNLDSRAKGSAPLPGWFTRHYSQSQTHLHDLRLHFADAYMTSEWFSRLAAVCSLGGKGHIPGKTSGCNGLETTKLDVASMMTLLRSAPPCPRHVSISRWNPRSIRPGRSMAHMVDSTTDAAFLDVSLLHRK
jgi:hypothetical protein